LDRWLVEALIHMIREGCHGPFSLPRAGWGASDGEISAPAGASRDDGFIQCFLKRYALAGLALTLALPSLASEPLPGDFIRSRPAQLRMSNEILRLNDSEDMGLTGLSYLINATPGTYLGLSAYGATSGGRGGFFTGGATLGTGMRLGQATLDAGLFVGGGGGGAAEQGGGLMVRPHVGLTYDLAGLTWGVGAAWVKFPNGGIDSKQIYLSLGIPMDVLYADSSKHAWQEFDSITGWTRQPTTIRATWARYRADSAARTTGGSAQADFDLLGFAYQRDFDRGWFAEVEAAGAQAGRSDGYAEVLFGAGWQATVPATGTQLRLTLALGAAGGGSVDTAGGGIARARLTLNQPIGKRLGVGFSYGRTESAGAFSADYAGIDLDYRLGEIVRGEPGQTTRYYLQPWDVTFSHQSYLKAQRKDAGDQGIDLVGIKLTRLLDDTVYLTGQAYGAYDGGAGGYAVGLIGAGLLADLSPRWRINAEALVGAGGGGGIDSGGGLLLQAHAGLSYRLGQAMRIQMELGQVHATSGDLDAAVLNLNWVYSFARPEAKP
jgi:hypothetical protein